jgi:integrase
VRVKRRDGTRPLETFGPGQRARIAAERRITELRAARYEHRVPVEYGRYTFGQAVNDALPGLKINVGSDKDKTTKETRARKLQKRYGHLRLNDITEAHSTDCTVWLLEEEELRSKTVNAYIDLFKAILDHAVAARKLELNPLKDQARLKKDDPLETRNPLTNDEWRTVLENTIDGWFRDALVGLIQTGMRRGELINLDWEDIDFNNNRIMVLSKPPLTRQSTTKRHWRSGKIGLASKSIGKSKLRPILFEPLHISFRQEPVPPTSEMRFDSEAATIPFDRIR